MSPLKNTRHEAFALALAQGLDGPRAYAAAGYRPSVANMARLVGRPEIVARVAELARTISRRQSSRACHSFDAPEGQEENESRAASSELLETIISNDKVESCDAAALLEPRRLETENRGHFSERRSKTVSPESNASAADVRIVPVPDETPCSPSPLSLAQEAKENDPSFGDVTAERVVRELARVAFADIRDALTWRDETRLVREDGKETVLPAAVMLKNSDDLDEDIAAAISEVVQTSSGLKIKLYDKRAALIDLGKYFGLFNQRAEEQAASTVLISDMPLDEAEWAERYAQETSLDKSNSLAK